MDGKAELVGCRVLMLFVERLAAPRGVLKVQAPGVPKVDG